MHIALTSYGPVSPLSDFDLKLIDAGLSAEPRPFRARLVVREVRGTLDLLAVLLGELDVLFDAPRWCYRLGGHYRWSLGGLMYRVGSWAAVREDQISLAYATEIPEEALIEHFGWRREYVDAWGSQSD